MTYLILYCLFLFGITYFAIKMFISLAPKLSLIDIPNERSSHKKITPRGAGLVFGAIFIFGVLIFDIENINRNIFILLSIFIIYIGGILDDLYTLSSKKKLSFIFIASVIAYFSGFEITYLGTYFNVELNLGWLAFPFTLFAIISFTNAVNLSDGLDGLAGSITVIMLTAILTIGLINDDQFLIVWPAILISVILAFLVLNWNPAKVFMGDSGSLLLGFVIALLSIKSLDYVNPSAIFFLGAVPLLDTLVVFRRRIQRGKSPFEADKNHLHHILNNIKQDKAFTVRMLILMQLSFCCLFLQLREQDDALNILTFFLLFMIFFDLFDPRARRRARDARLKKKYQKEKKKNKTLKEKLGLKKTKNKDKDKDKEENK